MFTEFVLLIATCWLLCTGVKLGEMSHNNTKMLDNTIQHFQSSGHAQNIDHSPMDSGVQEETEA